MDAKGQLGEKIIRERITKEIAWINSHCGRNFDEKLDVLSVGLTERQFRVAQKDFGLKQTYALCKGHVIDEFDIGEWRVKPHYNDRMGIYELTIKHKDYIEDFDQHCEYFEAKYGA